MNASLVKERIMELARVTGRGSLCIMTAYHTYTVNFSLYGEEVMARYKGAKVESEIFEFKDAADFLDNVRESVKTFDKSLAGTDIFKFPADSMVVQNKKDREEWFVVAIRGNTVEEIGNFRAKSLEEARKFYEEHREVDDRRGI